MSSDSSSEDEQPKKMDKKEAKKFAKMEEKSKKRAVASSSSDEGVEDKTPKKKRTKSEKAKKRSQDSDDDSGEEAKVQKKPEPTKSTPKNAATTQGVRMKNSDGAEMMEIGNMRYVTVRDFKGVSYVDIREFYLDKNSGTMKPGKKGISMSKEQYTNFKALLPEIEELLK